MMTNQITGVDRAGRSRRFGRVNPRRALPCRSDWFAEPRYVGGCGALGRAGPGRSRQAGPGSDAGTGGSKPRGTGRGQPGREPRYRFLERYSATDDPTKPELLTQYRVGFRETVKVTREKPQGAPDLQRSMAPPSASTRSVWPSLPREPS